MSVDSTAKSESHEPSESERFKQAMRKILSVSKTEVEELEKKAKEEKQRNGHKRYSR
jgi:hypothetical protein